MTTPLRMTSAVRLDDLIDAITKTRSDALDQLYRARATFLASYARYAEQVSRIASWHR